MRICLLTNEYPAAGTSSRETVYVGELAQGLSELGHDVTVICSCSSGHSAAGKIRVVVAAHPRHLGKLSFSRRMMPNSVEEALTLLGFWHAFEDLGGKESFDVVEARESLSGALLSAFCRETPTVLRLGATPDVGAERFDRQFSNLISGFARSCVDVFSCDSIEAEKTGAPGAFMVNSANDRKELASRAITIYAAAVERFATEKKPHLYRHGAERLIKSTQDMIVLYEKMLYDLLFRVSYKFRVYHWMRKLNADPGAVFRRLTQKV